MGDNPSRFQLLRQASWAGPSGPIIAGRSAAPEIIARLSAFNMCFTTHMRRYTKFGSLKTGVKFYQIACRTPHIPYKMFAVQRWCRKYFFECRAWYQLRLGDSIPHSPDDAANAG